MSVRMGILALLADGPSHGYQLKSGFEARTGGVWQLNVGQVYTTLDRLRADSLVEPMPSGTGGATGGGGRDRRRWRITPEGKEALEAWFDEPAVDAVPPRDELLVKVLLALHRSGREALAVIDRQRSELYALATAARAERRRAPGDLATELMAEAVAARHEAELAWLDRCEERVLADPDEGTPR